MVSETQIKNKLNKLLNLCDSSGLIPSESNKLLGMINNEIDELINKVLLHINAIQNEESEEESDTDDESESEEDSD